MNTPLIELSPTDVQELPDCDERAVLLGALNAENTAHTMFGWDETPPILHKFLAPLDPNDPADIIPIGLADPGPMVDKIRNFAALLRGERAISQRFVRPGKRYIGNGLLHEAWASPPSPLFKNRREEVRIVAGYLVSGEPFTVKRVRGQEPKVTFIGVIAVGDETGIKEALVELNSVFADLYRSS